MSRAEFLVAYRAWLDSPDMRIDGSLDIFIAGAAFGATQQRGEDMGEHMRNFWVEYVCIPGSNVEDTVEEAIEIAKSNQCVFDFKFNGTPIMVNPKSVASDVIAKWSIDRVSKRDAT